MVDHNRAIRTRQIRLIIFLRILLDPTLPNLVNLQPTNLLDPHRQYPTRPLFRRLRTCNNLIALLLQIFLLLLLDLGVLSSLISSLGLTQLGFSLLLDLFAHLLRILAFMLEVLIKGGFGKVADFPVKSAWFFLARIAQEPVVSDGHVV